MNLRSAVMGAWNLGELGFDFGRGGPAQKLKHLGLMCRYGMDIGRMTWRTTPVKVDELVEQWVQVVVGMCTAHDKDAYDANDAKADQLLGPILTAPINQVREFYAKLQERLRSDPKVPMIVWMGFEAWGECVIKTATDDTGIVRLRNKLAAEIAELVESDVADQIPKAIARALRWRDSETLQEVKKTLEGGAKPKLVGRQSCLFLEVGRGKKKRQVML